MIEIHHRVVDVDSQKPIVEHTFFGDTIEEAEFMRDAHIVIDPFLAEAVRTKRFRGTCLDITEVVEEVVA